MVICWSGNDAFDKERFARGPRRATRVSLACSSRWGLNPRFDDLAEKYTAYLGDVLPRTNPAKVSMTIGKLATVAAAPRMICGAPRWTCAAAFIRHEVGRAITKLQEENGGALESSAWEATPASSGDESDNFDLGLRLRIPPGGDCEQVPISSAADEAKANNVALSTAKGGRGLADRRG